MGFKTKDVITVFDFRAMKREECEFDVVHSECRDCYINDLECQRYEGKCRKE